MRVLSPLDTAWLHLDSPHNAAVISALLWFEGEWSREAVSQWVERSVVPRMPALGERVDERGLGPPRWVPLESTLGECVRRESVPREELTRAVGDWLSTGLDPREATWRAVVFEGLEDTPVLLQVHHCVADGLTLARLLADLADTPVRLPVPAQRGVLQGVRWGWAGARFLLRLPFQFAAAVWAGARSLEHLLTLPREPESGLRKPLTGRKRVAWSEGLPLDRVKAVSRSHGVSLNDILLAMVGEGLAGALREPPESVRTVVPVSLGRSTRQGNHFGMVAVDLPLRPFETGIHRVRAQTQRLKSSAEPWLTFILLSLMGMTPTMVERWLVGLFGAKATAVLTNVPGPVEVLTVQGRRLARVLIFVPQPGQVGLGIAVFSYAGQVSVGVVADEALALDPDDLVAGLPAQLERLESLG